MNDNKTTCSVIAEDPEAIRKERDYYREENRRLMSDNNDLKNLLIKVLFERYGF